MNGWWKVIGSGVALVGIMLGHALAAAQADNTAWTRSAILAVADKEAKRLGYEIDKMSVSFDTYNSGWRDYLASARNFVPLPEVQEALKDREYWAVYYAPLKRGMLGGDLWVFKDRATAEIITVVRGE